MGKGYLDIPGIKKLGEEVEFADFLLLKIVAGFL
jgi:hypothetical protein